MVDKDLIFSIHAVRRMFQRGISVDDVHKTVSEGKTIEEYSDDSPYPSRLVLGWTGDRPLHVVFAENVEHDEIIVITVYEPDLFVWEPGFEKRREL
ncbi:MAG: DUF4258 domain-containing protein [bacterium]|nr:DUF4258 domain-containing protein [bacterium]